MGLNNNNDFDAESYVKVNTRLSQFRAEHKDGAIVTAHEIVDGMLVMKATIYRNTNDLHPAGTGHAFLTSFDGEKVGEFTETVAVGRALAMMGYSVEKSIASSEEMKRFADTRKKKETTTEATPAAAETVKPRSNGRTSKFNLKPIENKE